MSASDPSTSSAAAELPPVLSADLASPTQEDELESLVKLLGSQIKDSGWVEAEIARKKAAGEPLVNVHDLGTGQAAVVDASSGGGAAAQSSGSGTAVEGGGSSEATASKK